MNSPLITAVFQPDSVKAAEIRKEANYAGVRVRQV